MNPRTHEPQVLHSKKASLFPETLLLPNGFLKTVKTTSFLELLSSLLELLSWLRELLLGWVLANP